MRYKFIALLVITAFLAAGCGASKPTPAAEPTKPEAPPRVSLVTTLAGDAVALDPTNVKATGPEVSLTLYFTKKEIKNGVKTEVWETAFKPSERLVMVKAKRLYNEAAQQVSADNAPADWDYVAPGTDTERIMKAVTDYCKAKGLALDDTPPPYALPGFMQIAKSTANDAFYLYKPSSVRKSGGDTAVEVLMINKASVNGAKYSLATVTFRPAAKQYQTTTQSLYDATGKKLSDHTDAKWYPVSPNSVYDMLLDAIR